MKASSNKPGTPQDELDATYALQLLVDAADDYAICMLAPDGYVASWNSGAERLVGYAEEEIIGRHFSAFYTTEDRLTGVPEQSLKLAGEDGQQEAEGWRIRKDGSRFWAKSTLHAVRCDDGKLIGYGKILRDITEKRQSAELIERARIALYQSQKMEAIGKLTGGVAHDFNNLLAVINNSLELLVRDPSGPNAVRVLAAAQRAVSRGATLTQQLLAYARRHPLNPEHCNLNNVLQSIESVMRRSLPESITLETQFDPRLKTVFIDVNQLELSLLNLLDNSRDAMPTGGTIKISTENIEIDDFAPGKLQPGEYVKITVADTGIGMSRETSERAMEPFFTTKGERRSSGMGLSQVYGFLAQSGGDVEIDSAIGRGARISMIFPVDEKTDQTATMEITGTSQETALIVEDDPDLLSTGVELFQSMGYEVLTAADGLDAVDILKGRRDIDVLFTDVVMPKGMSGLELARFTRRLCPDVKVILTSGYPLSALTAEHGNMEGFTLLRKPYRLSELAKELRTPSDTEPLKPAS